MSSSATPSPEARDSDAPDQRTPSKRWLLAGWTAICVELVLLAASVPLIGSAHDEYLANATDETGEAALEESIAFMVWALLVLFALLALFALFCLLVGVVVRGNTRTTRALIGCGVAIATVETVIAVAVAFLFVTGQ